MESKQLSAENRSLRLNMGPPSNPARVTIPWDRPMRERLRKAHKKAVKNKNNSFIFEDNEYLTKYAGYLLEYLDMKMK